MKVSEKGKSLIKQFESCRLNAYKDSVGVPTIGWGNTRYEDGSRVEMGDSISQARADYLFSYVLQDFKEGVKARVKVPVNQNQFDALVSFAYNVGLGNLSKSTLLKKVNKNPNDPSIEKEFLRWNKAGGKVLNGLTKRRQAEADLYFKPI